MSVDFNRATGLLILEVVNSNPNGDPDRENDPRQRPNGLGEISPVSVKRKIRDLIEDHDGVFPELARSVHPSGGSLLHLGIPWARQGSNYKRNE